MKKNKMKYSGISLIVILIATLTLYSCQEDSNGIYKKGDIHKYEVKIPDYTINITKLELKIESSAFLLFQTKINWVLAYSSTDGSSTEAKSTTGIVQTEEKLWLHPPRIGPLKKLEGFAFPEINFPIEEGKTWESSISVVSGFEELNGKVVKSQYVVKSIGELWEISTESEIEGYENKHTAIFLFDMNSGFKSMTYFINKELFVEITEIN